MRITKPVGLLVGLLVVSAAACFAACSSSGANQITCSGGQGAQLTSDSTLMATIHASTYPATLTVSGAPAGATITSVVLRVNGYTSITSTSMTASCPASFCGASRDMGLLLEGPLSGSAKPNLQIMRAIGSASSVQTNATLTFQDGATQMPLNPTAWTAATVSQTWAPTSSDNASPRDGEDNPNYTPTGPSVINASAPLGTATLASAFGGKTVNGTWNLYLADDSGNGIANGDFGANVGFTSFDLIITYSGATTPSTTTLTPNSATPYTSGAGSTVSLVANVTSGATGTVTFKDGNTTLTCSGGNPATLAGGTATCATSFSTEGVHVLAANYSGDATFVQSSGSANIFAHNHATNTGSTYCNAGQISTNGLSDIAYTNGIPYPSVIFVGDGVNTDINNSVSTVSVKINGLTSIANGLQGVRMLLLAPDTTHAFDFWSLAGQTATNGTYVIQDGASQIPTTANLASGTYGPTANNNVADFFTPGPPVPAPQVPARFSVAPPQGSASFLSTFSGAAAHGAWSLFLYNLNGPNEAVTASGGWCLSISAATGAPTTTTVTSNPAPQAALGAAVTFTATVASSPSVNFGTVTFTENGNPLVGAPNSGLATVTNGVATISTVSLPEGDHTITASYHDSVGTFNDSFGSVSVRVDKPTGTPTLSGSTWKYCNTAAVTIPAGTISVNDIGPAGPNPSNVMVTNLPGTVSSVSITLNGFSHFNPSSLQTLLVGPNGANAPGTAQTFDFFTNVGGINSFGPQTTTFSDAFPAVSVNTPPAANSGPGSYSSAPTFTDSPFFTLPSVYQRATTAGSFTFNTGTRTPSSGGVYLNTDPNGVWSLYFDQTTHQPAAGGMTGGWCMNFIENPVTGTGTSSHTGPAPNNHVRQGGTGSVTFSLHNNGDSQGMGSTGDPDGAIGHALTVTGTLPSGLTLGTVPTGSPWNCTASTSTTLTCTSLSAIAAGSNYPALTLPVNVAANATVSVTVSGFTFSGAGITAGTFNSDTIIIDPAPVLAISKSHTGTFTQGQTATWTLQVSNTSGTAAGATDGSTVTVIDTLPSGYTLASFTGTGWTCTGTTTVTCTTSAVVAGAGGFFNLIALTVNVPANSPVSVTNNALAFGGGDLIHTNSGNAATTFETLSVIQASVITSVTPNSGQQGQTIATVSLVGQFTHFVQGTSLASFGVGITVNSLTVTDATHATANIAILGTAATGSRNVTVTTGGETATLTSGFTVTAGTPVLDSVTPNSGQQGQTIATVSLIGQFTHFVQGTSTASFGAGITVNSLAVTDATHATSSITIDSAATIGNRNVTVTTGGEIVTLTNGFSVTAGTPTLNSVTPNSGQQGQTIATVSLVGQFTHFVQGTSTASFGAGITVNSLTVTDATHATANITMLGNAATGSRDVTVTTGGEIATLTNSFTVTAGTPVIASVTPNSGQQGQTIATVSLVGQFTHFVQGTSTASFGAGITVNSLTVTDTTHATANITILGTAATGSRDVTVTTGGETATLPNSFTVVAGTPVITLLNPNSGQQRSLVPVTITGNFTHFSSSSSVTFSGPGVTAGTPTAATATSLTVPVAITGSAPLGAQTIQIVTGGETVSMPNAFTVTVGIPVLITVTPANPSVEQGLTQQFTATGTYGDSSTLGLTSSVTWQSATTSVAGITAGGLATAVAASGTSSISATLGAVSGSTLLTALAPPSAPFLTGFTQSALQRNDYTGYVGMQFTVGSLPMSIYSLGRVCVAGNSQTHTVKLVSASTQADVPGATVQVNMATCTSNQFVYADLANVVILPAGSTYYLVSQEVTNGDKWYEQAPITTKSDATVNSAVYLNGAIWTPLGSPKTSYVPPDMKYAVVVPPPSPAFVLNYNLNNQGLRNDFAGFAGMSLRVGATPLNVTSLGRVCVAGNSQSHTVKFVSAATGQDVPGGSASVSMSGCTASQFVYTTLASPLTLQANTQYYLVSQEIGGGDQWYDQSTLSTKADATVLSSIYSSGATFVPNALSTSYVPPNFQYSLVTNPGAVTVTVGTNINGPSFSVDGTNYTTPQTFAWISGSQHTIATTTPQNAGAGSRYGFASWSDLGTLSHSVSPSTDTNYIVNFKKQYLLTTTVTGSGSITANPTSPDGYYDSSTSVQLTAAANPGSIFFNWTGDLSDGANPQSLTMSAPHSVTANFQGAVAASGFITSFGNAAVRKDFSGFVGMSLSVGANPLSVTQVGRACLSSSSSGNHTVKFVDALTGLDVPGASATVSMGGCTAGQFQYTTLNATVTLNPGTTYYLLSQETANGDTWYDAGPVTSKSDAQVKGSVYSNGASYVVTASPNISYVPPDFKYTVLTAPGPQPLVTAFNLNNRPTRNDFAGFVGMNLMVGAKNLSVSSLGRVCSTNNSQTHTVQVVNAATLAVVASALVDMSNCTANTFVYKTLGSSATLAAGTSYYLASQETVNGDMWFDHGTLSTTGAAQSSSSAYFYNGSWQTIDGPNTSYVPANLLYEIAP